MRKSEYVIIGMSLLALVMAAVAYPLMPERVASHWNIDGEVDGYMDKFWGTFLIPLVIAVMGVFFALIPRIDPLRANIGKFRSEYDNFIALFIVFMTAVYAQTLLWNFGTRIDIGLGIGVGLGAIFYYMGTLCEKSKRNYFIGVRTPWTLASDRVWERTHRLAGKLFRVAGVVCVLGALLGGKYAFIAIIGAALGASLIAVVYSYFAYVEEEKEKADAGKARAGKKRKKRK